MAKLHLFDQVIRNYVSRDGCFFIVSNDSIFIQVFKGLVKSLGLVQECLHCELHVKGYIKKIRSLLNEFEHVILFVEANFDGENNTLCFQSIKDAFEDRVGIVCLTTEMNRDALCLLHEMGADSVIIKPVSINSIIEKMAYIIKPNNLRTLVSKAKKTLAQENFPVAQEFINKIFEINPESSVANILLGDMYWKQKEYEQAENKYKLASSKARMYLEPLERLAELYGVIGKDECRLAVLERMDKISPLNHKRKIAIGDAYAAKKDLKKARQYYDKALSLSRKHARGQMAASLMEIGRKVIEIDPDQGIKYMNEAIELKSDNFTLQDMWMFNERGRHLRKLGKWEDAVSNYMNALTIEPENGGLCYNLAVAYMQGKMYVKALKYAHMALDKNPELLKQDISIPFTLARIYYHAKQFTNADEYTQMVLAKDPTHQGALTLQNRLRKRKK